MTGTGKVQPLDWAGSRILRKTLIPSKRAVVGSEDTLIPTDLREWITPASSQQMKDVIQGLGLPSGKDPGDFDRRARLVWRFVLEQVTYFGDAAAQHRQDYWQFPAETLALRRGDCEDCAFLLGSLLLAAGISPFCVRVVFGRLLDRDGNSSGHAWCVYKDERGAWRLLESTPAANRAEWVLADEAAGAGAVPRYCPEICLNQFHVWTVGPRRISNVAAHLKGYRRGKESPSQPPAP